MVATTPRNSIPYPQQGDSPNEATAMANLVGQVDRRMVPRFATTADRTTRVPSPSTGMIGYMVDTDMFVVYRDAAWQPANFSRTVRKTADTARTLTIVSAADPELAISVLAGRTYLIDLELSFTGDIGVDARTTILGPVGTTGRLFATFASSAATNIQIQQPTGISVPLTLGGDFGHGTFGSTSAFRTNFNVRGIIATTNAGTLSVAWAQLVSSSLPTTLMSGSSFTVTALA